MCRAAKNQLFDDLVGEREKLVRDSQANRLGGRDVDHQLIFDWRLHRQVGRLLAFEDTVDIAGRPLNYISADRIASNWSLPRRNTNARVTPGAISLSNSSHFPLTL
jgi:hypothetical protein